MRSLLLAVLATPILGSPVVETLNAQVKEQPRQVNGTVEYSTMCKSCPYDLCPNVNIPWGGDIVTLTCWAEGDNVGDTKLWLKTTENCYISEYDLVEYQGDFRTDLKTCGKVPLKITKQPAKVRYLSECKWGYSTSDESMKFYGRDLDVTLTCWTEGGEVLNNPYWYKTTDNCHVSGSGLWATPNREKLDNCGPEPGPRINETKRSIDDDGARPVELPSREDDEEEVEIVEDEEPSLLRRWLQPEQIGEEYAPCYKCPTATTSSTCPRVKRYEYNNTVVSQCLTSEDVTYPNGSFSSTYWLLTTDWCYVNGNDFWVPPWDNYRYPRCSNWAGYP
uniref:Cyanovirin-N domain-containing protein n=1 Tax=Bionectria ochroleuca TaxID=29856 RepID=A0A8H7KDY0_BIOOC